MEQILVINTGSTSTKLALFDGDVQLFKENIEVPPDVLIGMTRAVQQLEYRVKCVNGVLQARHIDISKLDMIAARGGPVPYIRGGAYAVTDYMVDVLTYAPTSQHESALASMIGRRLADPYDIPVIIYDAITANEADEIAQITGCPGIPVNLGGHPLNSRMVARTVAKDLGISYSKGHFIVAHLGGSISISAHRCGRIVDMSNAFTGPMSPQRAGRIPTNEMLKLCFSGKYSYEELYRMLNGESGFKGYLGTQEAKIVFDLVRQGNREAELITQAMTYQVAKGIAEMRIALDAEPDAIIFTGGMAHGEEFVKLVSRRASFLGPVRVLAGELEMEALAEGALRVLRGQEDAKFYNEVPGGYISKEEFYRAAAAQKQPTLWRNRGNNE